MAILVLKKTAKVTAGVDRTEVLAFADGVATANLP